MNTLKCTKIVFVLTIFFVFTTAFSQSKFKVALDAGHGDHDFGAVYHGHIEKNIALAVVLKVGKILEKNSGIEVIYTRKNDVFVDLIERANIANRADANIFVSVHCNANKNTEASGCETYVMGMSKNASNLEAARKENKVVLLEKDYEQKYKGFDPKSPETLIGLTMMQEEFLDNSIALAGTIQREFIDIGKKSRGVKQAPFMVLHKAYMPRVLIEMGFISNPKEGAILDSEEGQNEIAQSIANAIIAYKKENYGANDNDNIVKPSQKVEEVKVVETPVQKPTITPFEVKKPETKPEVKPEVTSGVVFKVQLSASSKKLDLVPSNFNGLSNISMSSEGTLYKYMYGQTSSYDEAKRLMQEARGKGYTSAFVIAFKDGKKVTVQEALKQ
ncbi:N-acetylmuramoyl-L-alanine amidase [Flavobacterium macrobrachii]|jgi:N-acetylmuramoyl-L-alanine amidase|uniref:N-acetylmuramoyl-L-alanine amidase n=1 Tax=Flavobacterium macrobrachii TaxID=591204 RepID=A0ABS2CX52_9FLAO|nr:N-acetylmuramoyl-L-alanine amidase [Flavobacterium macrobrachii]MBM6499501.1 N-acetylmuramoyl-L-alanine amidase [Flavobacterium macrobrachii]